MITWMSMRFVVAISQQMYCRLLMYWLAIELANHKAIVTTINIRKELINSTLKFTNFQWQISRNMMLHNWTCSFVSSKRFDFFSSNWPVRNYQSGHWYLTNAKLAKKSDFSFDFIQIYGNCIMIPRSNKQLFVWRVTKFAIL